MLRGEVCAWGGRSGRESLDSQVFQAPSFSPGAFDTPPLSLSRVGGYSSYPKP